MDHSNFACHSNIYLLPLGINWGNQALLSLRYLLWISRALAGFSCGAVLLVFHYMLFNKYFREKFLINNRDGVSVLFNFRRLETVDLKFLGRMCVAQNWLLGWTFLFVCFLLVFLLSFLPFKRVYGIITLERYSFPGLLVALFSFICAFITLVAKFPEIPRIAGGMDDEINKNNSSLIPLSARIFHSTNRILTLVISSMPLSLIDVAFVPILYLAMGTLIRKIHLSTQSHFF